uniref:Uncharacterized protein n=1 Tax=Rhizophora mucronata TaxID=61149 RepID=A0A2P2NED3_RHIMU
MIAKDKHTGALSIFGINYDKCKHSRSHRDIHE